MICSRILSI